MIFKVRSLRFYDLHLYYLTINDGFKRHLPEVSCVYYVSSGKRLWSPSNDVTPTRILIYRCILFLFSFFLYRLNDPDQIWYQRQLNLGHQPPNDGITIYCVNDNVDILARR